MKNMPIYEALAQAFAVEGGVWLGRGAHRVFGTVLRQANEG